MKKTFLIILSSFLAAAAFNVALTPVAPAFALEKDKIKVYYSEPLGTEAGDKVYHISACKKQLAYAPVTCIKQSKTEAYFNPGGQCVKGGKALTDMVRGCKIVPEEYLDTAKSHEKVDPDLTLCKDDPSQQKILYAQEWAVVNKNSQDDYKKWEFKGTIVWTDNEGGSGVSVGPPTSDDLKAIFNEKTADLKAVNLYRTGMCPEYDIFDNSEQETDKDKEYKNKVVELAKGYGMPNILTQGQILKDAGCNNSNADKEIGSMGASTPFNDQDLYSCTTAYRISGSSGSEIFGKYISALYIWVASIGGIIAVLIMVFSGIQISMAGADSGALDTAKNRIMQSLVGLVILFLAGLILYTINPSFFTG